MPQAPTDVPDSPLEAGSTREAIVHTATHVFLAHGYEQASMDQIALDSGVARRTLYNQFGNKKALFDATIAAMWERMPLDDIIAATAAVREPEEVLYSIGRAIASFWAPPEAVAFLRLAIWEGSKFPELGESFFDNGRQPARRAVTDYVNRLSREPGYRIDDPDLAAAQLIDVILGEVLLGRLVVTSKPMLDEDRCDYVVHEAVALFLARYRVHS